MGLAWVCGDSIPNDWQQWGGMVQIGPNDGRSCVLDSGFRPVVLIR